MCRWGAFRKDYGVSITQVQREAQIIKDKMAHSTIYGVIVDQDDLNTMIVAAYYLAKSEELNKRMERSDQRMQELFSKG